MYNYSSATVEGYVAQNPVFRKTRTGKAVCNFSVAMNHYSASDENSRVSYVDIETWEKIAEICSANVHKGKRIIIVGPLRQERWESKDGKTRSRLKVVGKEIRFIEKVTKPETEFKETEAA